LKNQINFRNFKHRTVLNIFFKTIYEEYYSKTSLKQNSKIMTI